MHCYIAFLMTLQHHLQSCGQVWNFGTSQPQHRGVESNGMQDMEKVDTTWKVDQPCSFGTVQPALELLKSFLAEPVNWFKRPRNSTLCSNVFVYNCTTVHATCPPISNNLLEWSIPACLLDSSAALRCLGTLLLTSVPSQLLTVAKISSNLLATDVEWIWMNDNESNSI